MANFIKQFSIPSSNLIKGPLDAGTQLAVGTSAERSSDPLIGEIRYNTDNTVLEVYDGTQYTNVAGAGNAAITKTSVVTGDGTTTAFTSFFATAPISDQAVVIVVGNVVQEPGQAYTTSGTTTLTFTSPPPNGHRIYGIVGFDSVTAI
jgi:hypothetical protein